MVTDEQAKRLGTPGFRGTRIRIPGTHYLIRVLSCSLVAWFRLWARLLRLQDAADATFQTIQECRAAQRAARPPMFSQISKLFLRQCALQKRLPVADHRQ
jgi:hypothetical protein